MRCIRILLATAYLAVVISQEDGFYGEENNEDEFDSCIARNGQPGKCVDEMYCNADHTIIPGGILEVDTELRELGPSTHCMKGYWCCTEENVVQPPTIDESQAEPCLAPNSDILPFAVSLFRTMDTKKIAKSPFCMGTLVGSRIILTAATCIKHAQKHMLYARLPLSPNPTLNYTVLYRDIHVNYNTGTHLHDIGMLILEGEIDQGNNKVQGACLDFNNEGTGDCMTIGFDANDNIVSTLINVAPGPCKDFGNPSVKDQACGTLSHDIVCLAAVGAPVLCESKTSGGAVVFGVVRSACMNNNVLIGSLLQSSPWLYKKFNRMNITSNVYKQD